MHEKATVQVFSEPAEPRVPTDMPAARGSKPAAAGPALQIGPHRPQRARGCAHATFRSRHGQTALHDLRQAGSGKIRFPKTYDGIPLAVFLNTAGGITGSDLLDYRVEVGDECHASVSTQAAERIYRALHGSGKVNNRLWIGRNAHCAWLPQETILFDRSALRRRFEVDLDATSDFLAVESIVLGRKAMGESIRNLSFHDSWRIRCNGHLVFADETRLEGDIQRILAGKATGNGAGAFATIVAAGPKATGRLDDVRELMAELGGDGAASIVNDILVARLVAPDGDILRRDLINILTHYRGCPMPRVWHC